MASEPLSYHWLCELNPSAESLHDTYAPAKQRSDTYEEMVGRIIAAVCSDLDVCVAAYGHPGVFASPLHEAIVRARKLGYPARMLPAISASDCLYADLGVDPGRVGCSMFEATDFLVFKRRFDTSCALILWQIGLVGVLDFKLTTDIWSLEGLAILSDVLLETYDPEHPCTVYQAAPYAFCDPKIEQTTVGLLVEASVTPMSTLYIPPKTSTAIDAGMSDRLGMKRAPASD